MESGWEPQDTTTTAVVTSAAPPAATKTSFCKADIKVLFAKPSEVKKEKILVEIAGDA